MADGRVVAARRGDAVRRVPGPGCISRYDFFAFGMEGERLLEPDAKWIEGWLVRNQSLFQSRWAQADKEEIKAFLGLLSGEE